ncbi:hypothetical protein [Dysgonomonas termitidis]|uniref:Zinc ribbon domain-containing protein n=1 Tax=Dysgonomonas termitidis TaxID=1516126 RepID=A0ABV9L5N3_9BACT
MICRKCNFKNDADACFCENCGADLQEIRIEKPRNKWNLSLIINGVFCFIIVVFTVIISINEGSSNHAEYPTFEAVDSISYENEAAKDSVALSKVIQDSMVSSQVKTEAASKKTISENTESYYNVITEFAYIYDYYGNSETDAYFDKIPAGSYYPYGTTLLIEYEFKGFGKITYRDEKGNNVRGFILMSDLKRN